MNYEERLEAKVYKPLIDKELMSLSEYLGTDKDALQKILDEIVANDNSAWRYLKTALQLAKSLVYDEAFENKMNNNWEHSLLSSYQNDTGAYLVRPGDDVDYSDEGNIFLEDYPEESFPALEQNQFWIYYDADVAGCWTQANKVEKIYSAHMENFAIIGEDPLDFLEKAVAKAIA